MLEAHELINANTEDIRVTQIYKTQEFNGETKQLVMRSKDTTLKKRYGGPQIYTVKVRGQNGVKEINPDTKVQVYCSCHDFIFRRAWCLNRVGSLLIPEGFLNEPPEKTNPNCNNKTCKHVSHALRYLISTRN
jgi:hypothetical protein